MMMDDLLTLASSPGRIPLDRSKLLRIIQAMVDAVLVFNSQGETLLCNPAFEKMIGLSHEAIVGSSLQTLFAGFDPGLPDIMQHLIQTAEPFSQEIKIYRNQQKRVYLLNTIPIAEDGAITEGVAVFHDITHIKQTEKMRRDFVANVSHELRTPLSAINGYAETLLEGALQDEAVAHDFIRIIFNHSQRLSQLVRDLLDLSKLDAEECPFELSPINLVPIIEKVIALSQNQLAEKQISLLFEPSPNLPQVMGNDSNLEQVLTNLLDNAVKYTPEGGRITVNIRRLETMIQVDVSDTGIGIEPKHTKRLFERFYRVDKARSRDMGGTGLGLSIVKHIVQAHGGEVWVESTPGKGSTFSFTLQTATCPPVESTGN